MEVAPSPRWGENMLRHSQLHVPEKGKPNKKKKGKMLAVPIYYMDWLKALQDLRGKTTKKRGEKGGGGGLGHDTV